MSNQSWATSAATRRSMLGNRGRDTKPELAVRRLLHGAGLRYRVNARPVAGVRRTADIVFTRRKVAVFIDGCYWHGCPVHYSTPRANAEFWSLKLAANSTRDAETDRLLGEQGWLVLRYWTHEPAEEVAAQISRTVRQGSAPGRD